MTCSAGKPAEWVVYCSLNFGPADSSDARGFRRRWRILRRGSFSGSLRFLEPGVLPMLALLMLLALLVLQLRARFLRRWRGEQSLAFRSIEQRCRCVSGQAESLGAG